jgi:hypothetical protein
VQTKKGAANAAAPEIFSRWRRDHFFGATAGFGSGTFAGVGLFDLMGSTAGFGSGTFAGVGLFDLMF